MVSAVAAFEDAVSQEIIALSTATPQWQEIRGHRIFTSIVRDPLPGPLHFGPDGPPDNETAVHTEAVLVTPAGHYRYWTKQFGLPADAWAWCQWGENIVLSDIDENDLRIGDILSIGDQAVFQVTSPRIPCFKLAWRMGQPDSVLRDMILTGKIGFYLKVLTPGPVEIGDAVRLESPDPSAITVGDLSRLLVDTDLVDIDLLQRVADLPALGGQARGMLIKRLAGLRDQQRVARGRWADWRPFTIGAVTAEAKDIASFLLHPEDGAPVAPPLAGQFLTVRLGDEGHGAGPGIIRSWSLSDYDDAADPYRLSIKRVEGGQGSTAIHALQPGDRIELRAPAGGFTLKRDGFMRVVLISAGIGITPMVAMLKAHAARADHLPPLLWIHQTRNGSTHAFRDEAAPWLAAGHVRRHILYSQPAAADRPGEDYDATGRIDPEALRAIIEAPYETAPFGRSIELGGAFSDFYICGPADFEQSVRATLAGMGVADHQIRSEAFAPVSGAATPAAVEQADIWFGDVPVRWSAEDGQSLLELAEAQGIDAPFGCRTGSCGSCEWGLTEGKVDYTTAPAIPVAPGTVLTCCARPASAVVRLTSRG